MRNDTANKKSVVISTPFGNVDTQKFDDKLWGDYKFVRTIVQGTLGLHKEKDDNLKGQVRKIREFLSVEGSVVPDVSTGTEEEEAAQVNGASKVVESTQGAL